MSRENICDEYLWKCYKRTKDPDILEQLVARYSYLVEIVSKKLNLHLDASIDYEDVLGFGTMGLIDAIEKFNYKEGAKFETYAFLRIKGTIIDNMRRIDKLSRLAREKVKSMKTASTELEYEKCRTATDGEIAAKMGITDKQLSEIRNYIMQTSFLSIEELSEHNLAIEEKYEFCQPQESLDSSELQNEISSALGELNYKEKVVIVLYYFEGLRFKKIANILGVSEARVSQLHSKALLKLRSIFIKPLSKLS